MNLVKFIGGVSAIGSVGKLGFSVSFIIFVLVAVNRSKFKIKLLNKVESLLILICLVLFAVIFVYLNRSRINLLPNLAFPIYFIFYYLIVKLFIRANLLESGKAALEVVKLNIIYVIRFTLYINFFVWFSLALIFNVNMFEIDGGFGGFFQDEIHFGLYMVTGFFVSFYMRFNSFYSDKSYFNLLLMIVYGSLLLYTSRNALLIVLVALVYFFVISRIKNWIYGIILLLTPVVLAGLNIFLQGLTFQRINEITSGRFQIWTYAIEKMNETNSWILGNGLFNLNDIVLKANVGKGSMYLDSLRSLSFHSSYLEILAAGGVIAVFLFFVVIIKIWKEFSSIDRSIMFGILIGASFESYLVQPFMLISSLFYLILLINSFKVRIVYKGDDLGYGFLKPIHSN